MMKRLRQFPFEALIWIASLVFLGWVDPSREPHFSLCPIQNLGLDFCPGCGLGRSISLLFRGQWIESFQTHPLGIFAVIVLSFRIVQLLYNYQKAYGQTT